MSSFQTPEHTYFDNPAGIATGGAYAIAVVVTDLSGAVSSPETRTITVNNVAPTASITGVESGIVGQSRLFTIKAIDPSLVDASAGFQFVVNWGDGTTSTYANATSQTVSHTFNSAGTFSVTIQATDKDGGKSLSASTSITIGKASPSFSISAPSSTFEGTSYHSAIAHAYGLGGIDLGAVSLRYFLASDTTLASPLSQAPTNAGRYQVVAVFSGNADYSSGQSAPATFAILQRATTTSIVASTPPTLPGQAAAFVATVSTNLPGLAVPAGEYVQFWVDGVKAGAPVALAADGTAKYSTSSLAVGSHAITAVYAGDANLLTSSSAAATQAILGAGVSVVGTTLYITGASGSDYAQISPTGSKSDGTTGLKVSATLNNNWISRTFLQPFTAISILGGEGNDNFQLTPSLTLATTVVQGNGNNYIQAGGGNDSFTFGTGSNQVFGGNGDKTVTANDVAGASSFYNFGNGNHVFSLGQGNAQVFLGNGNNIITMQNGTDLVSVGNGDNVVTLGNGNNYIRAGNGTNVVTSGNGTDVVVLGDGANTVMLGNGNDYFAAGNGNNTVTAGNGNVVVQLGNGHNTVNLGDGNDYVAAGSGDNTVTVGDGSNTVQLGNGDNVVLAGDGNDYISAGNGANLVVGGLGQHTIQLGNGNNILIDGSVTLTQPGDSLRKILTDWKASDSTSVNSRVKVTYNVSHPNGLAAGNGRNWFFSTNPRNWTTRNSKSRWN
ncbi:Ig-like domain repeat protein [Singulisphaera sp. PoT]|uniref:Ig-like domain repeat protein n=1 Tax=Singulisphaera sp. PoT TaxID=3411797 RepID=UPI003BF593F0